MLEIIGCCVVLFIAYIVICIVINGLILSNTVSTKYTYPVNKNAYEDRPEFIYKINSNGSDYYHIEKWGKFKDEYDGFLLALIPFTCFLSKYDYQLIDKTKKLHSLVFFETVTSLEETYEKEKLAEDAIKDTNEKLEAFKMRNVTKLNQNFRENYD